MHLQTTKLRYLILTLFDRIWVEGMDEDARVDIQPAADNLHTTLKSCTGDDLVKIADPSMSSPEREQAATALNQLSTLVTGSSTDIDQDVAPALKYVHRKTSSQVARARRGHRTSGLLGILPTGHDFGFHISFAGGIKCTSMSSQQALDLINTLKSEHLGGFLGVDWGDLWNDVVSGVSEIVDVVCHVAEKAVKVTINLIIDGTKWLWDGIITLATEVANIASAVFSSIKATWDKIVAWIGFLFDWGDINHSAQAIQKMLHNCDNVMTVSINWTLPRPDHVWRHRSW
jgi:hypothetical protein